MSQSRFPRTHELLRRDITRDPIFLLQSKRHWFSGAHPYEWDSDMECLYEESDDGERSEVTTDRLVEEGYAGAYWVTESVFLTREEGESFGAAKSHRYRDGWRVYCVHAEGALAHALADATEGGRYS